VVNLFRTKAL